MAAFENHFAYSTLRQTLNDAEDTWLDNMGDSLDLTHHPENKHFHAYLNALSPYNCGSKKEVSNTKMYSGRKTIKSAVYGGNGAMAEGIGSYHALNGTSEYVFLTW